MYVEALWDEEHELILGARHGDVEQAPLLLDLRGAAGCHVGGDATVDHVENEHRAPLLALGGMNRREDKIVLIEPRGAGLAAAGARRVEREVGEKMGARAVAGGDALQLVEVGSADHGVRMALLQMRL